jgi:PAS domain S-box-containing protein
MKDQSRKRIILSLRWTIIIVTSYLILFGKREVTEFNLGKLFVLFYIFSNVILTFFPSSWFMNLNLFYFLALFDTALVFLGMYLSENATTDFYLIFFLIIIFASIGRNFRLLMTISGVSAGLYGFFLYTQGLLNSGNAVSYSLRIPLIFIAAIFYGYIVQTFTREKQQQLALSENKYQSLFENAHDGIIILRTSRFQITDLNREVERLTGYKKEEMLGKFFLDLIKTNETERGVDFLKEVAGKGEGRTDSLSVLRRDEAPLEADLSIKRIDLEDESFYQVIFHDLTERRRLEKKIRESKRNLEAIFDSIRDRLSIQSPDYRILRVNRAVAQYHRTTFKDLLGKICYEVYYGSDRPCERCPVATTLQTGQPASSIKKDPDGETTFRFLSYPILDEKGNLHSVIEHVQDITEEQRLQDQLIQSEKLAGIGILASGVAHEINNPLSGIIGMAEVALEEASSTQKAYLEDVLNCAQRINEIVNGLRSYSRSARNTDQGPLDMNQILEDSLKMVRLATKTNSVEVIKKFEPVEKVEANAGQLQQVFVNLITNAFQAMNGREGRLVLSTRSLKDLAEVKVSDNGMGIPQQYLKKIFDPFFTTKNPGEGTGLGLNIVYRIITNYEGTIDVESKEGAGTTFTIKLPVKEERS